MWILAASEKGVVFVANLGDFEETALCADVGLLQVFDAGDDGGACRAGDAVVVGLTNAADGGDVGLDKEVLGQIYRLSSQISTHIWIRPVNSEAICEWRHYTHHSRPFPLLRGQALRPVWHHT